METLNVHYIWKLEIVSRRHLTKIVVYLSDIHISKLVYIVIGHLTYLTNFSRELLRVYHKVVLTTNKLIEVDKMASQYSALDFEFLYVKDMSEKDAIHGIVTAEDNLPRLNVWMLQEPEKKDLLKVTLKPD